MAMAKKCHCGRSEWEAEECRDVHCGLKSTSVEALKIDDPNARQVAGSHYSAPIQHWDFVEDNGLGYLEGNATKYLSRWRKKNGLQDLQKAMHYIDKLISLAEQGRRAARGTAPASAVIEFCEANGLGDSEREIISHLSCRWRMFNLSMAKRELQLLIDANT